MEGVLVHGRHLGRVVMVVQVDRNSLDRFFSGSSVMQYRTLVGIVVCQQLRVVTSATC